MNGSYWQNILNQRTLTRRRALALAGTGLSGAALLAACGGDSKDGGTGGTSAGALNNPKEGSFSPSDGSPQAGGRYKRPFATGPVNFNPVTQWTDGTSLGGIYVYDRPLTSREDSRRYVLEAMQSIEVKDPLTVVMKLRPGMKYGNVPPVNGREVEAEDYVQSQKYEKDVTDAFDKTFVNSFLDKAEAVDKQTVVLHLKRPSAYLFGGQLLGSGTGQVIIPKETIGPSLDTAVQVGSGPYLADPGNRANVHYLYKQSPTYWGRAQGYDQINEVEATILIDKSAQQAAFYGGQFDFFEPTPAQMKDSKQQVPNAHFYELPGFYSVNFSFNMFPERNTPWRDVRVREAIWRTTNREDLLKRGYQGAGVLTNGLLPVTLKAYQVDPKDVEQYTRNDVAKAKQLLSAAGYDESKTYGIGVRASGDVLADTGEVLQANLARAGIKTVLKPYGSAFFALLQSRDWDFLLETPPGNDTPGQQLRTQHTDSWSDVYRGFALFDKEIDAMIEKSEETIDFEQNRKMVIDIQKLCMSKFTASWEVVTHFQLFILGPKVQNYELTYVPNAMRHSMWMKS
jgi:peptide/nickel transport system substrate-binding protein